ncbi:membrane protein [Cytophagales bacterium WSM2-2]|nr:membrane protein [Cytophagales bacterium WSM2-2]
MTILQFMLACFVIRLISLGKSIYNEKRLKSTGALEFGKVNSAALTIAHVLFYASCLTEALYNGTTANDYTYWGLGLFAFSMIMLWWVILSLGNVWTVKLIISTDHVLKTGFLFRHVRHPNYFLNVIPELISVTLICNAWMTLAIGLPVYLIPLAIRIRQEEKVMKEKFPSY